MFAQAANAWIRGPSAPALAWHERRAVPELRRGAPRGRLLRDRNPTPPCRSGGRGYSDGGPATSDGRGPGVEHRQSGRGGRTSAMSGPFDSPHVTRCWSWATTSTRHAVRSPRQTMAVAASSRRSRSAAGHIRCSCRVVDGHVNRYLSAADAASRHRLPTRHGPVPSGPARDPVDIRGIVEDRFAPGAPGPARLPRHGAPSVARLEQLLEAGLVEDGYAELLGLVGLGAGVLADDDVVGLLRDRARRPCRRGPGSPPWRSRG